MSNIFDLSLEYIQIMDELEENGGELTDDILDRLNINKDELDDKLENYRKVIAMINGRIETIAKEQERLTAKAKVQANMIEKLKERMKIAVNLYGDVTKTGNKTYTNGLSKFTVVKTHPLYIAPSFELDLDNKELLPYVKGSFVFKTSGEDVVNLKSKLTALGISFSEEFAIDKTSLKKALSTLEKKPDIDANTKKQRVDDKGNLMWIEPFDGEIKIDEESSYVKIT